MIDRKQAQAMAGDDFDETAFIEAAGGRNKKITKVQALAWNQKNEKEKEREEEEKKVEEMLTTVLLPGGRLSRVVQRWHDDVVSWNDREHIHATLKWLQLGSVLYHFDSCLEIHVLRLLSIEKFTRNLSYMEIFDKLQLFVKKKLMLLGDVLKRYYEESPDVQSLGTLTTIVHPSFLEKKTKKKEKKERKDESKMSSKMRKEKKVTNKKKGKQGKEPALTQRKQEKKEEMEDAAAAGGAAEDVLRQDHPIVGLTAESFNLGHFGGESKYIHVRNVSLFLDDTISRFDPTFDTHFCFQYRLLFVKISFLRFFVWSVYVLMICFKIECVRLFCR